MSIPKTAVHQLWHFEENRVAIHCRLRGVDQVIEYLDENSLKQIAKMPVDSGISGFLGEIHTQSGRALCYVNLVLEQIMLIHLPDEVIRRLPLGEAQSQNVWGPCVHGGVLYFGDEFGGIYALNERLQWEIAFESMCRSCRLLHVLSGHRAVFLDLSLSQMMLVDLGLRTMRPILLPSGFVGAALEARGFEEVVEFEDWLALRLRGYPMYCIRISGDGSVPAYGPFGLPVSGARGPGWVLSTAYHNGKNALFYVGVAWMEPKVEGYKSKRALRLCKISFDKVEPEVTVVASGAHGALTGNEVIAGFLLPRDELFVTGDGKFFDLTESYSGKLEDMTLIE